MEVLANLQTRFLGPPPNHSPLIENDEAEEDNFLRRAAPSRASTDTPFFIMHAVFLGVLVCFLGYCMANGEINRIIHGHDGCGNTCGSRNYFLPKQDHFMDDTLNSICQAEDMSQKPYLYLEESRCVAACPTGSVLFGYRCINKANPIENLEHQAQSNGQNFFDEIARDLHSCTVEIIELCFIAVGFTFVIFLLLRYLTEAFVWSVLAGIVMICVGATAYFWYLTDSTEGILPLAIFFSIITMIIIIVIIAMRNRIQLVIQLLKEAGKAIAAIPVLIVEPLLTFVVLAIIWTAWIYFTLWILSAGTPTMEFGKLIYKQNAAMRFAYWYNLFMMLWMVQFVYGCQNMLIAGAVSIWFFTRDKTQLNRPIITSGYNMIKYHLGTISFGSLLVAVIQMMRILYRMTRRYVRWISCCLCLCCCSNFIEGYIIYLERFLKYFTRNAYVVTAIYGYSLYRAGTRAFTLLVENALRVIAITSVGDFVLVLSKLLVVLATVLLGLLMLQDKDNLNNKWVPLLVVGIVAYLIAHCFIVVYEMAVDTIFICFCEDYEINDGISKPFYMSRELMEFVENSKAVLGIKDLLETPAAAGN